MVGCGAMSGEWIRSAQEIGIEVSALVDLNLEFARARASEFQLEAGLFDNLDEAIRKVRADLLFDCTIPAAHAEVDTKGLMNGLHVLVEKPLTSSVSEARKLAGLAERSGLVLMCDHTYCFTPTVRRIRGLIRDGEIGDVQFVDSVRINLGLVQPDVDVLWDLAPHDLSILDFVLPAEVVPVAVAAHAADPIGAGRACLAYLSVWLSTGALAHIHVNWLSPMKIRTTVIGGSRRTIVWDDMNPSARLMIHDRGVDRVPDTLAPDDRRQALISYRVGDISVPALPEREALMAVMTEFASAITERRQALTDGRAGIHVLALLEAASQSAENGGIKIPVVTEAYK